MSSTVADLCGGLFEGLTDGRTRVNVKETDGVHMGYFHAHMTWGVYPVRLIDGELVAFRCDRGSFVVDPVNVYRVMPERDKPKPPSLAKEGWIAPTPTSPECSYTDTRGAAEIAAKIRSTYTGSGRRSKEAQLYWFCGCSTHYPLGAATAELLKDLPETGYTLD